MRSCNQGKETGVITARIRRMGKALFSQVSVRGGGTQSEVLCQVSGPSSFLRGVPQAQVISLVSDSRSFPWEVPQSQVSGLRSFPGYTPVPARGYASSNRGVPQSQPGGEYPSLSWGGTLKRIVLPWTYMVMLKRVCLE